MAGGEKEAATATVSSGEGDVVAIASAPKRSMRKRKRVSYGELNEDDSDIAPETPKKKVTGKSNVKTPENAAYAGEEIAGKATRVTAKSKIAATEDVKYADGEATVRKKTKSAKKEVIVIDDSPAKIEKPKPKSKARKRKARPDEPEYDDEGNEIRKREYQDEPSDKFLGSMARALSQPLRFIDRQRFDTDMIPQEKFTIAGSMLSNYTVEIKLIPQCSCPDHAFRKAICKHIIYTLVKVLKVPTDSPLLYQQAFTSAELHEIFEQAPEAPFVQVDEEHVATEEASDGTGADRKPIDGECPICYMEFEPAKESITYCKAHCGNNVHQDCIATWLRSQQQMYHKATCPYCRVAWAN